MTGVQTCALPILEPNDIELSVEKEAKLKKRVSWNAKLSHWVVAFSEASTVVHCAAFVTFWLCKFVFWFPPDRPKTY